MKAGITRPDTLTRCALSSSAPPDATLVQRAACYGADSRRATPRPEICGRATAAHSGLRVAYLGGALVELAGGDDRARLRAQRLNGAAQALRPGRGREQRPCGGRSAARV